MTEKTRSTTTYIAFGVFVLAAASAFVMRWQALSHYEARIDALEDRDKAIQGLIESSDHGFAILDEKGQVKEWNAALERWTGYTAEEMVGRDIAHLMSEESATLHLSEFARAMSEESDGETRVVECQITPKDDAAEPVDVRVSVRVVKSPGKDEEPYAIAQVDRPEKVVEVDGPEIMEGAKP